MREREKGDRWEERGQQEVKDGLTRAKLAEDLCCDSYGDTQAGRSNGI